MITRDQFKEEDRRIAQLKRDGKSADFIKSWLKGWRMVLPTTRNKRQ